MQYPKPSDEHAFEEFALHLVRRYWSTPLVERYAHRGEGQDGVDLLDVSGGELLRAAQCKLHAPHKSLSSAELRDEVEKAEKFEPPLGHYLVLTTAKKSGETQKELVLLNRRHREQGLFSIELLTWEGIERLIDEYPDVQARLFPAVTSLQLREPSQILVQQIGANVTQAIRDLLGPANPDARDSEIDEAKAHLERDEFQFARLLLNRIRQRHWDSLTARQRYRVAANTGAALMGEASFAEAGHLLVEAASYQPDDLEAQALGAVGHELLDETAIAYQLVGDILARAPGLAKAAAVRVRTAPTTFTLEQLIAELRPSAVNPEVAVALAMRGIREKAFQQAEQFALRSTAESPDWPVGWLVLGQVLLARETEKLRGGTPADQPFSRKAIEQAELHLTAAMDKAKVSTPPHPVLVDAFIGRARTRELLSVGGGTADVEEAYRLAPRDPEVRFMYAVLQNSRGNRAEATRLAREAADGGHADAKVLLGILLFQSADPSMQLEGAKILQNVALESQGDRQVEAAIYAARAFCELKNWPDAAGVASAMREKGEQVLSLLLEGLIQQAQGNFEDSQRVALDASAAISAATSLAWISTERKSTNLAGRGGRVWRRSTRARQASRRGSRTPKQWVGGRACEKSPGPAPG